MSKLDCVDVGLGKCCVTTAQANPGIAVKGTRLSCECGRKIVFDGRWRLDQSFAPPSVPDSGA